VGLVRKRIFFDTKNVILPRQARDKHKKYSKRDAFSCQEHHNRTLS
jgi:hypothetical protein